MCACVCSGSVCVTPEERARAHVAECEADDGGFVQVSSHRRLQRQNSRQIAEHVGLHAAPPPGGLAANGPVGLKEEGLSRRTKILMDLQLKVSS